MKHRIVFKGPDVVEDSLERARLTPDERESVRLIAKRYVECDEYVTLEIDTEDESCRVVPRHEL